MRTRFMIDRSALRYGTMGSAPLRCAHPSASAPGSAPRLSLVLPDGTAGDTKAQVADPAARHDPVAARRPEGPRPADPAPAPAHPARALGRPGRILLRLCRILVVPVPAPFPHVAVSTWVVATIRTELGQYYEVCVIQAPLNRRLSLAAEAKNFKRGSTVTRPETLFVAALAATSP